MNIKIQIQEKRIMKNESVITGVKIGATIGGLVFLVFVLMPEFSLARAVTPIAIVELMVTGLTYFISRG